MNFVEPKTVRDFILYDPIGSIIAFTLIFIIIVTSIKLLLDWQNIKIAVDLTKFCIGGAC